MLLELEEFDKCIWEPAAGEGHISGVLKKYNYDVYSTDIIKRTDDIYEADFLKIEFKDLLGCCWNGDIITNPPYSMGKEFVEKAMSVVNDGHKVAMFLKLQFLEGKARAELFKKYPPKRIYVSRSRLKCGKNGDFSGPTSAVCYCWYIWEKGWYGAPEVRWFN